MAQNRVEKPITANFGMFTQDDAMAKTPLRPLMQQNGNMGNLNNNEQSQTGQIGLWANEPDQWSSQKEAEKEMEKHAKKRIQQTILIPLNAVGMVIGKKGKNIKIIRKFSFIFDTTVVSFYRDAFFILFRPSIRTI